MSTCPPSRGFIYVAINRIRYPGDVHKTLPATRPSFCAPRVILTITCPSTSEPEEWKSTHGKFIMMPGVGAGSHVGILSHGQSAQPVTTRSRCATRARYDGGRSKP